MATDHSGEIETISSTLLRIGDRVVEVSRDHVVTRIWERKNVSLRSSVDNYLGKKVIDTGNDSIMTLCDEQVEAAFITGEDGYIEYTIGANDPPVIYGLRILNCHPDKDFLFVVIENLSNRKVNELVEDKWKLALDATGDGVWDLNMETNAIFFSEKWHEIFGYDASEIVTGSDWGAKIHPEDLAKNRIKSEEYIAGKVPSYITEMRYLCKDGTYKWVLSRGIIISRTADGKPLRFIGTHTDINERKIAEEKYFGAAELLAKLINNLQDSILVTDENWKVIFVNQVFCDMFAIVGNPLMLNGLDMRKNLETRKLLYVDSDKFERRTIEIFDKKKIALNEEWELADGRILCRDYIPLSLGNNNNKGGIWKLRDITTQKNVENRFEKQRVFYERILNNISVDIAVYDVERRYLFVNPVAVRDEELRKWLIGKTDEEYCVYKNRPISMAERRSEIFNTAANEKQLIEWEEKTETPDGTIAYHLRRMYPVFNSDGTLDIMIGYGLDITERIVARQAAKTSIDTFSSAFDHSGIGMAIINLEGKWVDVNKVLCELTGYSKEELLQHSYHDITYPDDDEMDRPLINKLLNMEISTYTVEKRYVSKSNKIVLVSLTVSLVWNNDDSPKFFIAQVVDITEKKALENDIRRKNFELEATRISLVNKISQLEELNHIIAHNLRGPSGNIKMFSEILLAKQNDNVSAADNPLKDAFTDAEVAKFIYDSSAALMNSLSTLMEITEIKLNKEIPYNDCDIADVINGITTQLQGIIHEKKAVIISELETKSVRYPKAYLENILYNLVSNALKYSNKMASPEIIISTRILKNKKTQLTVKDNGIGIDLEKYGDKVFKLNQIFHAGYDSKGVGLYITKTQIESLGGSIEIKSKPDEGCEFIVTI